VQPRKERQLLREEGPRQNIPFKSKDRFICEGKNGRVDEHQEEKVVSDTALPTGEEEVQHPEEEVFLPKVC